MSPNAAATRNVSNNDLPSSSSSSTLLSPSPSVVAQATAPTTKNAVQQAETASKKRRASHSGSRGVANLTPEQLAKKRANDREAQRAIRERTKNQIETLERRIKELTSQQPYQELQQVIRQKELIEAENAEIKKRLLAVMNIMQPLLGGSSLVDATSPTFDDRGSFARSSISGNSQPSPYSPTPPAPNGHPSNVSTRMFSPTSHSHAESPRSASLHNGFTAQSLSENNVRGRGVERVENMLRTTSAERLALGLLPGGRPDLHGDGSPETKRTNSLPADSHITLSSPMNTRSPHEHPTHVHRQALPLPVPSLHHHTESIHHQQPQQQGPSLQGPIPNHASYSTLPAHTAQSCLLDGLLLDFIADRRHLAASGVPELELIGPAYPDLSGFVSAERRTSLPAISKLLTDILGAFPDISTLPELVATFYGMFLTMRWHVCPTPENYERLPDFLRPTSWQILSPHPIWIDHLPWPEMRDELVRSTSRYPFENFFVPFTKTLSLNWPYDPMEIFLPRGSAMPGGANHNHDDGANGELYMNPAFETHLRELSNWSVGTRFAQAFPLLAGNTVRIEDHEDKEESKAVLQ